MRICSTTATACPACRPAAPAPQQGQLAWQASPAVPMPRPLLFPARKRICLICLRLHRRPLLTGPELLLLLLLRHGLLLSRHRLRLLLLLHQRRLCRCLPCFPASVTPWLACTNPPCGADPDGQVGGQGGRALQVPRWRLPSCVRQCPEIGFCAPVCRIRRTTARNLYGRMAGITADAAMRGV